MKTFMYESLIILFESLLLTARDRVCVTHSLFFLLHFYILVLFNSIIDILF